MIKARESRLVRFCKKFKTWPSLTNRDFLAQFVKKLCAYKHFVSFFISPPLLYVGMNETSKGVLLKNPLLRISRVYRTESSRCREFYVRSRAQCKNSCRWTELSGRSITVNKKKQLLNALSEKVPVRQVLKFCKFASKSHFLAQFL